MNNNQYCQTLIEKISKSYNLGQINNIIPFGNGRINKTFKITSNINGKNKSFLLQEISPVFFNENADAPNFKCPSNLMHNIDSVCEHLTQKALISRRNMNQVMMVIKNNEGKSYVPIGKKFYRIYNFIENSLCFEVGTNEQIQEAGKAMGLFHSDLADYDAHKLFDILPNFHNTYSRYNDFVTALAKDSKNRSSSCQEAINIADQYSFLCGSIIDGLMNGSIPTRVIHNDTKIGNFLFDATTKKAITPVDYDTVGPGSVLFDLGDAIRSMTNICDEDSPASEVKFVLDKYNALIEGYFSTNKTCTPEEINLVAKSGLTLSYELGLRFLTDYLNGDTYFSTTYENQNLDRAMNQFALLKQMDKKYEKMYHNTIIFAIENGMKTNYDLDQLTLFPEVKDVERE